MNILMLVGSLRADSWTGQVAAAVGGLLPARRPATVYAGLADLPHYDQDLDSDTPPAPVVAFREAVAAADALVVATPEYNGSVPGVLKNALDWASRPRGASALAGTPVAVVSVSPSPARSPVGPRGPREDPPRRRCRPGRPGVGVASVHDALVEGRVEHTDVHAALTALVEALLAAEREPDAA